MPKQIHPAPAITPAMRNLLIRLRNRATLADVILNQLREVHQRQDELTALQQQSNHGNARFWTETAQQRSALHTELARMRSELAEQQARMQEAQEARQLQEAQLAQATQDARLQDALEASLADMRASMKAVEGKLARVERMIGDRPLSPGLRRGADRAARVHFFFQVPETWSTWESVWRACMESPHIQATIVLLPFVHGSAGDPSRARKFLAERSIPFVHFSAYSLDEEQPDLVFLQNPYDSTRPPELAVDRLLSHGVRIAYIPYGLDVGGGQDNLRWQYDLDVQRKAWRIFVRSEDHRRMYGLHCLAGNRNVVVTGHPKIDNIVTRCRPSVGAKQRKDARKTVLWCPHFSLEAGGWSTFMALYDGILGFFEQQPADLSLVVRPHPLFFGRLQEIAAVADVTEQELRRRFHQPPWIALDEKEDYSEAFLASDALMTDAGSFLLEYLPTEKPILYLHNPEGPGLNESAAFVDSYYRASGFAAVRDFVEMVRHGDDSRRGDRLSRMQELLHRTDGSVGTQIVTHIAEQWRQGLVPAPSATGEREMS
jgi:hypothetical protein